ncbi:PREDICTED: cadmium-induced protein AS8-like isoform X2 [Nelumbo nucifera]|nr:PREDICTED: cadmium-induced protein AS8-like isoform X2 [Nelumbo nucifera]XP_019053145.1 PREDICTED: cadmium-induced protein AS8-like isoform X2 [Nelumbo nucifera]
MIIKGLFKRYAKWNPVHPTSGAFWGMGIGVGCGVGWGPGFGPEVIGYVGAGCGVGFSVGITVAGFGIGLPANFLVEIPSNAFAATRTGALEFARSSGLLSMRNVVEDGWNHVAPHVNDLQRGASGRLSSFKHMSALDQGVNLKVMKNKISCHVKSTLDNFVAFRNRYLSSHKGTQTSHTFFRRFEGLMHGELMG